MYLPVIVFAGILVYYPILSNQLLNLWDDQWVVMNPYTEGGLTIRNALRILIEFYHGQYAPFNEYLYLILYAISGSYDPVVFHLASLLIHIVNACLVFIVMRKLLRLSGKVDKDRSAVISFLTALVFCIHPLNVESVAWMSASKILVYALFYLLATYTFLLYLEKGRVQFYIYTIVLYVFSFLGKEQAVAFPMWMLLIYWVTNYKLSDKRIWIAALPFFALSLIFGILTIYSQYTNGVGVLTHNADYPFWQRIVFACYSLMEYLFKIIIPFKLSYLYPFPSVVGEPLPSWLLVYPTLTLVIIFTLWKFIKRPPVAFGLMSFIVHIAIALHIIPLSRFAIVADRYAYLSIIGISFIFAFYTVHLYDRVKLWDRSKILIIVFVFSYMLYLGGYAHQRTYVWYSVSTLKKELRELLKQRNDYMKWGY